MRTTGVLAGNCCYVVSELVPVFSGVFVDRHGAEWCCTVLKLRAGALGIATGGAAGDIDRH